MSNRITITDAALRYNVSASYLAELCRSNLIDAVKISRMWYILEEEVKDISLTRQKEVRLSSYQINQIKILLRNYIPHNRYCKHSPTTLAERFGVTPGAILYHYNKDKTID